MPALVESAHPKRFANLEIHGKQCRATGQHQQFTHSHAQTGGRIQWLQLHNHYDCTRDLQSSDMRMEATRFTPIFYWHAGANLTCVKSLSPASGPDDLQQLMHIPALHANIARRMFIGDDQRTRSPRICARVLTNNVLTVNLNCGLTVLNDALDALLSNGK